MYECKECDGVSTTSSTCENPSCPDQPCCGKNKANCYCFKDAAKEIDPKEIWDADKPRKYK